MTTEPDEDRRKRVLAIFAKTIDTPPIAAVHQRGRDAETARFTIELQDGRKIRIGTVKTLRSQTELGSVLAVAIGSGGPMAEQKDWRKIWSLLFRDGITVQETDGENFTATVREWLAGYSSGATHDREGAAAGGLPFIDDDHLHVQVDNLTTYLRGKYGEVPRRAELWSALAELGFERVAIHYTKGDRRSSKSYYRALLASLED